MSELSRQVEPPAVVPQHRHDETARSGPVPYESASPAKGAISSRGVMGLQRTAGNAAVILALQRAPTTATEKPSTDDRLQALEDKAKRDATKDKATRQLDAFKAEVLARVTAWEIAILNLGSAYSMAAKNHTDAVEAKKKIDAIKSQVMFSVLTVATAGGLAWVSGAAQAAKAAAGAADDGALLTNVLEDVLQTSASEALSGNGPGFHQRVPTAAQTAVSTDPLVFQNQRLVRLKTSHQQAQSQFKSMSDNFLIWNEKEWDHFDLGRQQASFSAWLAKADVLKGPADLPSVEIMARELERGFWARWAPALRTYEVEPTDPSGRRLRRIYTSPTTPVESRLDALGITKDSGINDFGWWTSDAEIDKLVGWAAGYVVKPFG